MRCRNIVRRARPPALIWSIVAWGISSGCTSMGEPPEDVCVIPYWERRQRCNEEFLKCLESPLQDIRSETFGQSLCHVCQDVCMQRSGVWPDILEDGRRCR